jgi:3-deoxy-D-manno-octulosonate 8-phosphate phosphatase (KDO 8-P phosphatase)
MGLVAEADLAARCQPIELLVADVDGVLTDGVIALNDEGVETKHFYVRDGMAYALWHRAGKQAAILSGRRVRAVEPRAAELKIRAVGLAACPADAAAEVKDAAHLITRAPGGRGAVREVIEVILKSQGRWSELIGAAFGSPSV